MSSEEHAGRDRPRVVLRPRASIEAHQVDEAQRRAEIIRAWLLGYAQAQREIAQLLERPAPSSWRSRRRRRRERRPGAGG